MSNNKKLIPKLRLKKFIITKEWQQVKLGDVSEIIGGGTPSTNIPAFWSGDIDWYSPTEIGNKIYVSQSEKKITQLGLSKSSAKILPIGTILYTSRAGIGNTAILAKEATTNQGFQSIVPKQDKLHSYFIYSRTKELKRYGEAKGGGSTFKEISGKQLAQMPIFLPVLNEQIQIGEFFKKLDTLIQTQQKKIEKTKNLKSAYLAEMFPCDGELKPKLRFKGFNNNWIYEKLGKVTKWSKGTNLAKDVLNKEGKGNSVIHYADLYKFAPVVDGVIHWSEIDEGHIIPQNSLLFPMSDVTPNGLARTTTIIKANVRASSDTLIATISNEISAEYLSYEINAHSKKILPLVTGTTVKHINANSLSTLLIKITEIGEQYKIAKLLNLIENYISLEQRKLEKLNNIKQAYLNEMFV